ncbi:amidohydrolase family protein [Gracilimonas sp. Q87]|uniref:amidohydrolase family protein n=1 Tax=Gracilimonas sp. Q87 TaxID=3384766 RepID=UPI0039841C04
MKKLTTLFFSFLLTQFLFAQEADTTMTFEEYQPESTLVVPGEKVTSAKYPFIDIHSHLWRMASMDLSQTVQEMDSLNMKVLVNLSGRSGETLKAMVDAAEKQAPGRFVVFANIDFDGMDEPDWTKRAVSQLQEDYDNGARGVKIFKNLGLTVLDSKGDRIKTDDPRIDPVWAKAGELGIPVLIHTGEPAEFWEPIDNTNERWLEMKNFPDRHRGDSTRYPSWEVVMQEQWNVFRKHPETTFINAHFGWMANDLARLGEHLDEFPNVYTETAAIIAELGRQPRYAKEFFIKYQDRLLFGKDTYRPHEYHTYFRVLESDDEYFDYFRRRHAFWKMYGLDLPNEVLEKVYYKNALKIIPGIDESLFNATN